MTAKVIQGDCMSVLAGIPDGFFDAIVTDPPYGIDFQSNQRVVNDQLPKIANDKRPFVWWLYHAGRVLKDGGCLVLFCRWDVAEDFRTAIGWAGLDIKAQVVWDRDVYGMGDLTGAPAPRHDTIWFATRGRYAFPGRRPTSVIRSQRVAWQDITHPNEKPVELMRELVRDYVPRGGIVLDPFAGSGATGEACVLEGRRFVGVELDAKYAAAAQQRIDRAVTIERELDGDYDEEGNELAHRASAVTSV